MEIAHREKPNLSVKFEPVKRLDKFEEIFSKKVPLGFKRHVLPLLVGAKKATLTNDEADGLII